MISITDIQDIVAATFFNGSSIVAGMVMYSAILLLLFVLIRRMETVLVISLPVTFVFYSLGILTSELMILLIIVAVIGLATATRDRWASRCC